MKIPIIKRTIEKYSVEELRAAEEAMYEEQTPAIEIEGEDDGEKLTHILASIWVKEDMAAHGTDMMTSIRAYSQRVRNSIS